MNGPDTLLRHIPQSEFISKLAFEGLLVLIGTILMGKLNRNKGYEKFIGFFNIQVAISWVFVSLYIFTLDINNYITK